MRRFNEKVLGVSTSFPTVEGVPADDAGEVDTVAPGKTKTEVSLPMNWHKLSPKWRAAILARLVKRVIETTLSAGSPKKAQATFVAFRELTGWGGCDQCDDLLAALKRMHARLMSDSAEFDDYSPIDDIEAAIARAEGRQS